ncbi:MAG: hypothetical protein ABJN42_03550 [Roseibium sp.]|uniref:hypothetical protein n=1 Tax=Roseibium sp. TaxID=1936156 RepID=UPI0032980C84
MLFPGYIYGPDEDAPINFWSIGMSLSAATGLTMEDDWIEFDADQFPHIKTSAGSAGFLHGSEDVILFDGPEFRAATV